MIATKLERTFKAPAAVPKQPTPTYTMAPMQLADAVRERVRARMQLTNEQLIELALVHAPPPEFFEADEERPW